MVEQTWQDFLTIVREEVGSRVVETWFKAVFFTHWDALRKEVYLKAPNSFVKDWICKHYLPIIQKHMGRLLHAENLKIVFIDDATTSLGSSSAIVTSVAKKMSVMPAQVDHSSKELIVAKKRSQNLLNSGYTFDTFVVGSSNSLAYAAAKAVSENPGVLYNPLFMYGQSGLGKTHLLHAIGNAIKDTKENLSIVYQTADRFVSEFINAIRFDKIHLFQKKYQMVDVLLIDDIQFISNKDQTQEAFFHIFNALHNAQKQIVFSSDTFPQNISGIAERLRSRLGWGLVVDLHMPSLETKIAILKQKVQVNSQLVDDEVLHFIAEHISSNIRELEGSLIRVTAFASLTKQPITLDLAKKVLLRSGEVKKSRVEFEDVLRGITKNYPYTVKQICDKGRNKDLAIVRQITMYLMKKLTDKSLRDIGSCMGGRDHSTVMHAIERMEVYLKATPSLQQKLQKIEQEITG